MYKILCWAMIVVMLSITIITVWTWNTSDAIYYIYGNRVWVAFSYRGQFCLFYKHILKNDSHFTAVDAQLVNPRSFYIDNDALYNRREAVGPFASNPFHWGRTRLEWADHLSDQPPWRGRYVVLPLCFSGGWSEEYTWIDTMGGRTEPEPGKFVSSWEFPHWFVLMVSGVIWWVASGPVRRERRVRWCLERGICPKCGYDLRAHKAGERCPECGEVMIARTETK